MISMVHARELCLALAASAPAFGFCPTEMLVDRGSLASDKSGTLVSHNRQKPYIIHHCHRAMDNSRDEAQRRVVVACALTAVATSLALVAQNPRPLSLRPVPMRISILSGRMWLDELLAGHPERFNEQFGTSKHAFQLLSRELQLHSGPTN